MSELKIIRSDSHNFSDCHEFSYEFLSDSLWLKFYQMGSRDLAFMCIPREYQDKISIDIDKADNYLLYNAFSKLYDNIVNEMSSNERYFSGEIYKKFYDGNKISWQSDAMADEDSMWTGKIKVAYNYLNIIKTEDEINLEFINNSGKQRFSVEFNTDRSRYERLVFHFIKLLRDLEYVTEENHQVTIDEWLYEKKLTKK